MNGTCGTYRTWFPQTLGQSEPLCSSKRGNQYGGRRDGSKPRKSIKSRRATPRARWHPAKRPCRSVIGSRVSEPGNAARGHVRRSTITGSKVGALGVPHRIAPTGSWERFLSDHRPRPTTSPAFRLHPGHSTHAPTFSGLTQQRTENRHRLITGRGWGKKHRTGYRYHPSTNTAGTNTLHDETLTDSAP